MAPPSTDRQFPDKAAFDTALIRVDVGTGSEEDGSKRTFHVRKGVLTFYSGYFNTSLNSTFAEASSHIVRLPTEDPLIFDIFINYIHERVFFASPIKPSVLLSYAVLAKAWVFGDAHEVPIFQNAVVNEIKAKVVDSKDLFDAEAIHYIWANTVETSKLRGLVADMLNRTLGFKLSVDGLRSTNPDDIIATLRSFKTAGPSTVEFNEMILRASQRSMPTSEECLYHVHEEGVLCTPRKPWQADSTASEINPWRGLADKKRQKAREEVFMRIGRSSWLS